MKYFFNIYVIYFYLVPFFYLIFIQKFEFIHLFLILLFFCFYLGLNINLSSKKTDFNPKYSVLKINAMFLFVFFFLYFIDFKVQFETLISLLNGNYIEKGLEKAISRYEDELRPSIISQFSTIFYFCYCFSLGSFISNNHKKQMKILFLFFWLILSLFESSTLSRASLLLGISGLASTFIYNYRYKIPKISLIKIHIYLIFILIILLAVFSFSAYGRVSQNENIFEILLEKLAGYTIAMYDAFLIWLRSFNFNNFKSGMNTFTFIPKLFGYKFEGGYYQIVDTKFGETNIYTNLRGIIEDFSALSFIFFFLMGLQINILNSLKTPSRISFIANFWVINFFLFPIISIFNFTIYFIGYMIFTCLVELKNND